MNLEMKPDVLPRREEMTKFFLLGLEIFFRVRTGNHLARYALDNFDASLFQGLDLLGIVREQAHPAYSERFEHLAGKRKIAVVGFKAQTLVGFDGIQTRVLQLVSLQFGHQADAAAFLLFVNEYARAQVADHGERHLELLAAVAAQRMKNVARQTLRMDAHQRRSRVNVPHYQGDSFFNPPVSVGTKFRSKAVDTKISPPGGEIRRSDFFHCIDGHTLIIAAGKRAQNFFRQPRPRETEKIPHTSCFLTCLLWPLRSKSLRAVFSRAHGNGR